MFKGYKILTIFILVSICTLSLAGCSIFQESRAKALSNKLLATNKLNNDESIKDNCILGINDLGYEIIKDISSDDNLIFSPFSLACALAMVSNGADGETKAEVVDALSAEDNDINDSYNKLINHLNAYSKEKLRVANSAWFNKNLNVNDEFADQLKEYFDADTMSVDFSDSKTTELINDWIKDKTEGLIKDTVKDLDIQTAAMLINTLYFKGEWENEFKENLTKKDSFKLSDDSSVDVDMMFSNFSEKYYEDESCQIVKLSYRDAAMYIILPTSDLNSFMISKHYNKLDQKIADMEYANVDVYLPKFKFKSSTDLVEALKTRGIKQAFDRNSAQFNLITDRDVFISKVLQDAYIEVDEKGTEAAAATVVEFKLTGAILPEVEKEIKCDRPFMYVIKDERTGVNLFAGVVNDPSK